MGFSDLLDFRLAFTSILPCAVTLLAPGLRLPGPFGWSVFQGSDRSVGHREGCMVAQIDMAYPFSGRWLVRNSPANRVPSHGTALYGQSYAIDFVPVDESGRTAPVRLVSLVRPEPPERFPGFGQPILAPVGGTVLAAHDTEPDHRAHRGLPSVGYMLTQGRRAAAGWVALAGNHVLIESGGVVVGLCHLRRGSVEVRSGQRVNIGDLVAECGNSGNSTEPHLHIQAMDGGREVKHAHAVRMTFRGSLPRNGEVVGEPQRGHSD